MATTTVYRLTPKGQRWLRRYRQAKHLAGWSFILLTCLAFLALCAWVGYEYLTGPTATIPERTTP